MNADLHATNPASTAPAIPPGYKQTEVGVIPEDWHSLEIGDFIDLLTGFPFPSRGYTRSGTRLLRGSNVKRSRTDWSEDLTAYWPAITAKIGRYFLEAGDIVVAMDGSLVGRSFAALTESDVPALLLQRVSRIRSGTISQRYLQVWICSQHFTEHCDAVKTTTAIPHISPADIRSFRIAVPPAKAEQDAIAEALSDADALIESLEQFIAKKRHIKQGAMQELLTGKRRLPGFEGEWEVKVFGDVVQLRKERFDPRRSTSHELCIELEHIESATGRLIGYGVTSDDSSLKSVFSEDDVLFGKLRAYLRKYWMADREGVCSTEFWVFAVRRSLLLPQFLFQLIKVDRFIEAASSAYGTHMPRSDWNVVKNYAVGLPSIQEQAAIAAILSDMDAEISALEEKLSKARLIKQGMMQELLTGRIRLV